MQPEELARAKKRYLESLRDQTIMDEEEPVIDDESIPSVLSAVASNAGDAVGQTTGDFARRLQAPRSLSHEEQVLAQVGQGAGQAVGQTAADFTQRAQDMRRPWQLGPIEFDFGRRPATPTHEQQTLASVAQGAGDAVGQTTADLARRIQNRPWELGEIEFDFSGRQAPSPPTYEQQALAQMASGTGNAWEVSEIGTSAPTLVGRNNAF